jgi:mono/diheme cytochrome c family protein
MPNAMPKRPVLVCLFAAACGAGDPSPEVTRTSAALDAVSHGRQVWFQSTFGGERFFGRILPAPPFSLNLGFDALLTSNRDTRFDDWGAINDPDCTAGDASTGWLDRCADEHASGIIGVRKYVDETGRLLVGIACAACHAGLDPIHPPADPNHPTWNEIHPTIGNQYLKIGKIFAAHLSVHDPRWQVFHAWAPGTVDTTAIESDHIDNPGVITPIWDVTQRPFFDVTVGGVPVSAHRSGQGGEDDAGCERAALRVYFNIGMCAEVCMVPHLANGPGGAQTPIDLDACRMVCPELGQAEAAVGDLCEFLGTVAPPRLVDAPGGARYIDWSVVPRGEHVFAAACASCHGGDVLSDDEIHPAAEIGTNSCRALTTNWTAGHIWAEFSSDQYKERSTGGPGFYRDVPLLGVWATAPFFHNNRLGAFTGDPSVGGRIAAYEDAMRQLLDPWRRDLLGSISVTTASVSLPTPLGTVTLPAGIPIALFANLDPEDPLENLCLDLIENEGHIFGATLSPRDKRALIEFLKTR